MLRPMSARSHPRQSLIFSCRFFRPSTVDCQPLPAFHPGTLPLSPVPLPHSPNYPCSIPHSATVPSALSLCPSGQLSKQSTYFVPAPSDYCVSSPESLQFVSPAT